MTNNFSEQLKLKLIKLAIEEDIGNKEDYTSLASINTNFSATAIITAKESGVIAGLEIAKIVGKCIDETLIFKALKQDGEVVEEKEAVLQVKGNIRSILKAERIILNFMQRMSGIATKTNRFVSVLAPYKAKILDTRKTTPGMRWFEKEAVRIGKGENHRFGLYDMIMIKDNHIKYAGSIQAAIKQTQEYLSKNNIKLKVEIEVSNIIDLQEVMSFGAVNRIMLDNFNISTTLEAVKIIDGKFETESSGNISLNNIVDYAKTGVDYISCGALTHHIKSLDLSLNITDEKIK